MRQLVIKVLNMHATDHSLTHFQYVHIFSSDLGSTNVPHVIGIAFLELGICFGLEQNEAGVHDV